ncbi:isochorismate synthase [Microlunatus ginsengisoli]|uniref:isochorismate synthase n=1 Tax=Microlunatus ginsengisoli TaxID=363863 RepID=A0ABP6ZLD6_9ACTN
MHHLATLSGVTWPDTPPRLYARTVEIDDPGRLLDWLPERDAFAWIRDGDGMVGWGEVVTHKPTTVLDADQWWSDLVGQVVAVSELGDAPAGAGFMAFGSFVFDPDNTHVRSVLTVPETIVGRRRGRCWMTRIGPEFRHDDVRPAPAPARPPRSVSYADGGLTGPQWEAAVAQAVRRIGAGEVDKVVLARDLLARAAEPIDPRWLVGRLAAEYSRCWTYRVDGLVGATPEMLVRQENGLATSRVLAGTIRRSGDSQRDLALASALARSSKDLEEHEYAVASVARALAPFCSGMHVPDAPYVLELPNVLHLATDVTAVADQGTSALRLAAALHPSAAVCGTPTAPARAMIAELEKMDRERYAGPVGWIDARGDGEWGIALRCGQLDETDSRQIRLFAGCGIVAGSDPEAELAEAAAKLVPMRDALGG